MSTIEEAREQARVVKESVDARLSAIRLGKSIMRASDKDILALRQAQDALATLLDATEPPEIQYADSATVAALAEKIAGENAELMDRLAVKPAEDEREALIERIAGTIAVPWLVSHGTTWGDLVQRSRDPYMRDAREVLRVVEAAEGARR